LTIIGKNPEKYGFNVVPAGPVETERVSVDKATDLRVIAEAIHFPVDDLRAMNAQVLRWTTPPDDPDFQLILPKGYAGKFNEQISSLPESKRILFREHVVQRGETISGIARKYGTTSAQLVQANDLGKPPVLKAGKTLVIPLSGATPPQPQLAAARPGTTSPRTASTRTTSTRRPASSTRSLTYTVRSGDTLAKIAARHNTSVEKLKSWNHLTSTRLTAGKRLIIGVDKADAAN